ncbi:phosphoglycolate phosphatase [Halomicrobium zhouii]|uniref:Phosphoglycolate phosphatase n=1 Tax=Halomicrobium zhouii TaxID=767519 RepID=A0A1I6KR85_9EURY|nr:phosphoglycolate phosphatase [Halomicrobium zhouii]SFR93752.1 phosphoglycolate phosphatase [Halomicrobium zhouii]
MDAVPPLVVDVDGTLTGPDRAVDPRVFPILRDWAAPVVVATGKAFPFPVALCDFLGIELCVVAENGGVVFVGQTDALTMAGDPEAANAVADAYREMGYDLGWGPLDFANRWRETELAVSRDQPLEPLQELAVEHDLVVVDTGFAYHVKAPDVDKGTGLRIVADELDLSPEAFLAVGDSENDAPTFELAGESVAVVNADDTAKAAADRVTDVAYADGFLEAIGPYVD